MLAKKKKVFIYQVRADAGQHPSDIITELTHAVWKIFMDASELRSVDPHRWPSLYMVFRDVFKTRLVYYEGCGDQPSCHACLRPVWGGAKPVSHPANCTYTLEMARNLDQLIRALSVLAYRRFRDLLGPWKNNWFLREEKVQGALRRELARYLFESDLCLNCHVRRNFPERRVWQ